MAAPAEKGGGLCWFHVGLIGPFPAADGARAPLRRGPLHEAHHPRGAVAQRIRSKEGRGSSDGTRAPHLTSAVFSLGHRHDAEGAV